MINRINSKQFKMLRILLTSISIILIARYIYIHYDSIKVVDISYIALSILLSCLIIPLIVNDRWKYYLSLYGVKESIMTLAKINFVSVFYGLLLPSSQGFDVIRVLLIEKRHPNKRGLVGSSVVLERITGLVTLCIIASIASLFVPLSFTGYSVRYSVWIVSAIVIVMSVFLVSNAGYRLLSRMLYSKSLAITTLNQVKIYVQKVHESLSATSSISVFLKSFFLIFLFQISTILNVYLVFLALGINISFKLHLALMPVVYIVSMIPITISGIGLREGVFAFLYGKIGISVPSAVVASLLNYFILTIIPAVIGLLIIVTTKYHPKIDQESKI